MRMPTSAVLVIPSVVSIAAFPFGEVRYMLSIELSYIELNEMDILLILDSSIVEVSCLIVTGYNGMECSGL